MRIIDGVETETQPNGTLTIQVNLTEEQKKCKNLTLYHLTDDGELIAYNCEVNGDVLQFKTDHLSMWARTRNCKNNWNGIYANNNAYTFSNSNNCFIINNHK